MSGAGGRGAGAGPLGGLVRGWRAPGPVSARFVRDVVEGRGEGVEDAKVFVLEGPLGSGKSNTAIQALLRLAWAQTPSPIDGKRYSRFLISRNSYPELTTTTIKTFNSIIPLDLGELYTGGAPIRKILPLGSDGCYGEAEFEFMSLEDLVSAKKKMESYEMTAAWINEAKNMDREVVEVVLGRLDRYPSMAHGGPRRSVLLLDTNPPPLDHWLSAADDEARPGWRFYKQPSGLSPAAENLQNLPDGYYQKKIIGQDKGWIKVYVEAQRGDLKASDAIYTDYNSEACEIRGLEPTPGAPIIIGVDYGGTPAAVITQKTSAGQLIVLEEITTTAAASRGAVGLGEEIAARLAHPRYAKCRPRRIVGDPAGEARSQADAVRPCDVLQTASGIRVQSAATNDPHTRIDAVRLPLGQRHGVYAGLVLDPQRCPVLRRGFLEGYKWRKSTEGEIQEPMKNAFSHVHDALQYAAQGHGFGAALLNRRDANGGRTPSRRSRDTEPS